MEEKLAVELIKTVPLVGVLFCALTLIWRRLIAVQDKHDTYLKENADKLTMHTDKLREAITNNTHANQSVAKGLAELRRSNELLAREVMELRLEHRSPSTRPLIDSSRPPLESGHRIYTEE